ncbi:PEP-CTERM sorting domain-containing protein [Candidatus Poribacteria bacterium]|nr:PEP-CTERM sorting domain-containing protein [Candidatus Poribacteria bacterium]
MIANHPGVQNFSRTFTLNNTTTLDFMIRDYYLPDNAGGVALNIHAAPEPSTFILFIIGGGLVGMVTYKRKRCEK